MLINCAGLKGLSSMNIISATFITIIFPQICDKHQTFLTPICFLYLASFIAYQSYALVICYCRMHVPTFSLYSLPEQRRNGQISSIRPI